MSADAREVPLPAPPRAGVSFALAWLAAYGAFVLPLAFTLRPPMVDLPARAAALATPPAVTPPAVTTPAATTPAAATPAVTAPAAATPAVTPPAVTPPAVATPAVTIPAVTPPAAATPAVTPPAATTPAAAETFVEPTGRHPMPDVLARLAEASVPPVFAARVPYGLALVVLPLSALFYVRRTGGDPWWSLAAFPLTLGFGWWQGWPEVPLGMSLALGAAGLAGDPARGRRGAVVLVLLLALTGLTDPAVFVAAVLVAAAAALARGGGLARLGPTLAGAALGGVALVAGGTGPWIGPGTAPLWARLPALPGALFGVPRDPQGIGIGVLLAAGLWAAGARARRGWPPWAPALAGMAVFAVWPSSRGLGLAGLVALLALGGLSPGANRRGRLTLTLAVLAWSAVVAVRCAQFTTEARGAEAVLAAVPAGARLEARIDDPFTGAVPGLPAYRHYAAWYTADGRGRLVPRDGTVVIVRDPAPRGPVRARHRGWSLVDGAPGPAR